MRRFQGTGGGTSGGFRRLLGLGGALAAWCFGASFAAAAISWDGDGGTNWWFDYVNWGTPDNPTDPLTEPLLPPNNTAGDFTDIQINPGTGAWDLTGEGVVFDPDNDPFYSNPDVVDDSLVDGADFLSLQRQGVAPLNWSRQYGGAGYGAEDMRYPTGSIDTAAGTRDFGPQTFYRMYISRNTTNSNTLTIKSGDIAIHGGTQPVIVGRSGSSAGSQNLGRIVQEGGTIEIPNNTLDMGQSESSGWGNGTYDYRGGTLWVQSVGGNQGIRLSAGSSSNGAGGIGRFVMHNPATGGRVHTFDFTVAAIPNQADGVIRGVGVVEFHLENGGTRPIQVDRNLSINNGVDDEDPSWVRSSRLELVLDEAPAVDGGGVPQNLGLFDVNFENVFSGTITGTGDLNGDLDYGNDQVFSSANGMTHYYEGDTVSAVFGNTQYNWTITYTGDISWTDAANSVVDQVLGAGNGTDVVLAGLSSGPAPVAAGAVPEPATALLAVCGAWALAAVRRRK